MLNSTLGKKNEDISTHPVAAQSNSSEDDNDLDILENLQMNKSMKLRRSVTPGVKNLFLGIGRIREENKKENMAASLSKDFMRSVTRRLTKKINQMDDGSEAKRYWRHVKNKKNVDHFLFHLSQGKKGNRRGSLRSKFHFDKISISNFT